MLRSLSNKVCYTSASVRLDADLYKLIALLLVDCFDTEVKMEFQ